MHSHRSTASWRAAVTFAGVCLSAGSIGAQQGPEWTVFAPATDVVYTVIPERTSFQVGAVVTFQEELVNVSNRSLYISSVTCPQLPVWLEDSTGRHVFGGSGAICGQHPGTLIEHVRLERKLLKPGEHLTATSSIDTRGLAPGDYRVEAAFAGWNPKDFSDSDLKELAKMDAPLLRGEATATAKLTLTK
jgi:hypothetical protein